MNILKFIKNILITGLIFFAYKADAQILPPENAIDVAYGMPSNFNKTYSFDFFLDKLPIFALVLALLAVVLTGIISPIIGYRWYAKHGGAKKWIGWLAYAPLGVLVLGLAIVFVNMVLNEILY